MVIAITANDQVEKWSRIIYVLAAEITPPIFILPKFIKSFYVYSTTDLRGDDAFELPFPTW